MTSGLDGRPSLRSLADTLGLSTATISNVFNKPSRVAAATRERVLAEAARVGFSGPDPAARQLRRGRTDTIGLVFTDELPFAFRDQAAVGFLTGLATVCESQGYNLALLSGGVPDRPHDAAAVTRASIDAVVVYSVAADDPHLRAAAARGLPIVVVDQPGPGPEWDWVGLDDRSAARAVGRHLAAQGHQHVGIVASRLTRERRNGPARSTDPVSYGLHGERMAGLCDGLREGGVRVDDLPVEERYESSEAAGADAIGALLARQPAVTAVFCLSDALALGALRGAVTLGLDVPAELSIVGFDDIEAAAHAGLTTVSQPLTEKGRTAGDLLFRRLAQRSRDVPAPAARRRALPTTLQVRRTTGRNRRHEAGRPQP